MDDQIMRRFLFKILKFSGIPFILRETIQKRKITIVYFHDPLVDTFNIVLHYLKKHYNVIPLNYYIRFLEGVIKLPPKSIIITLDDGHKNNYKLLDLVKELKIPITIFLCSEIFDTNRHFWWTHINNKYELKNLKTFTESEKRILLKKFNFDYLADYGKECRQALNEEEVNDMASTGLIEFQSHTMYHALLDKCDNDLSLKEMQYSKINLENKLNIPIYAIAYPNGYYSSREITYAPKLGYKCAVTIEPGFNTIQTNQFKLKRLGVGDKANLDEIIVKTSGLWGFFKKIKKTIFPSTID